MRTTTREDCPARPAPPGTEYHKIVEGAQVKGSGFAGEQIYTTPNVVVIQRLLHERISAYYSRVTNMTDGLPVREWLAGQPYSVQFEFGLALQLFF